MDSPIVTQSIDAGDPAPDFSLPTPNGRHVSLSDFAGKPLIIFFYPKDDTEVCTREALAFSGMQSRFSRRGAAVLGVSPDPPADHAKFIKKYALKVALASDEDLAACNLYGVWGQKTLYGRTYMGVIRSTFLIDPKGVIRKVWRNVRVPGHVEAVFEATTEFA